MKKKLLKILIYVSIFSMLLTLCSGFASAVDPVSTATMANALAQAITAYGASHGVSITFDVANSNGIGEGMHKLWNNFKTYINDNNVPTYDSLANTMWATIYTKIGNYIGININDTEMPYIDAFWNWLLSGPAEMTKVDNQYYEWTINNGSVNPINIYTTIPYLPNQPFLPYQHSTSASSSTFNESIKGLSYQYRTYNHTSGVFPNSYGTVYFVVYIESGLYKLRAIAISDYTGQHAPFDWIQYYSGWTYYEAPYNNWDQINTTGIYYTTIESIGLDSQETFITNIPVFQSWQYVVDNIVPYLSGDSSPDTISLKPYIGDTAPQNIYIPNNDDVNYSPLPYVGGLDIPWNDTLYGDGTETLTDAQSEAISGVIDNSITDSFEKTLTLVDTENPDVSAPNEVYIPFLPLQLPSFNFSLSGIWHYVVTWVGSIGSWFTAMFNMWSCLPYAMVVPVYATLVVVIVLGVYRRFLS